MSEENIEMLNQLFDISNYFFNPYALPVFLVSIFIFFIGIFVLKQNKTSLVNIAFFYECLSIGFWLFTISFVYLTNNPLVAITWYRYFTFFGVLNIMPSLLFFSIAWSGEIYRKKPLLIANIAIVLLFYLLTITTDKVIVPYKIRHYFWGFYPVYGPLAIVFMVLFLTQAAVGYRKLYAIYKREVIPIRKKQIGLITVANILGFTAVADFIPKFINFSLYPYGYISLFIFIAMVAYSIVRYKAFDIETALHKTIAWFLTNLILVIPFALFLYFTYFWYSQLSDIGFLIFLAFFGAVFLFFVRAFHSKIDNFFQRRRYDLEEIANQFTEDLVQLKGIIQVSQRIKDVIKSTLYSQKIDLFVYDPQKDKYISVDEANENSELQIKSTFLQWLTESNRIIYKSLIEIDPFYSEIKDQLNDYFDLTGSEVIVPLILGKELVGLINLSKKATFKRYTALDFHFLTVLKNQSAIAISNSLLYDNMEDQVKKRTEELIDTQKQLIRAEKMATVGILAGGVAHEINNPLTAILTNVQFLLSDPESVDEESLRLMEEATKRCRTIVQKLMLYARKPTESGQVQLINILDAVGGIVGFLSYQLKQENIKIEVKSEQESYPVVANQNEIEQVITNLILNARDAIKKVKKEGVIEISILDENSNIIIKVKDEGVGISDKELAKIFDPFFTTKDVGKGTGLGLSICQSIVQKYQGSIEVESNQGKGAIFIVVLPRAEAG